jgi:hypothetical protein
LDIDQRTDFCRLGEKEKGKRKGKWWIKNKIKGVLRMRCDHFRRGSPTLVFRQCFSLASLCRLPFKFKWGVKKEGSFHG